MLPGCFLNPHLNRKTLNDLFPVVRFDLLGRCFGGRAARQVEDITRDRAGGRDQQPHLPAHERIDMGRHQNES